MKTLRGVRSSSGGATVFSLKSELSFGKDNMDVVKRFKQVKQDKVSEARVDAHRLDLKNDEFTHVAHEVHRATKDYVDYLYQSLGNIKLDDRSDEHVVSRTDDASQVLTITFNNVRHEITFEKNNGPEPVHRAIVVDEQNGKPFVGHRKFGSNRGELLFTDIADLIRKSIDALFVIA
jgi:hypothetical protein